MANIYLTILYQMKRMFANLGVIYSEQLIYNLYTVKHVLRFEKKNKIK